MPRDAGEPAGCVDPADEDDPFDFRPERRQRRADTVAAIEQGRAPGRRYRLARRLDDRLEPTRTGITASIGRAGEHDATAGPRRRGQRSYRLAERMDGNDSDGARVNSTLL